MRPHEGGGNTAFGAKNRKPSTKVIEKRSSKGDSIAVLVKTDFAS